LIGTNMCSTLSSTDTRSLLNDSGREEPAL
jgi:hypothetical protein